MIVRPPFPTPAAGALLAANNLSDIASAAAARTNLGVLGKDEADPRIATRQTRNQYWVDGYTAYRACGVWPLAAAASVAALPTHIGIDAPAFTVTNATDRVLFSFAAAIANGTPSLNANNLNGFCVFYSSGNLILQQNAGSGNYRKWTYSGFVATYPNGCKLGIDFVAPDTTTNPVVTADGIDVSSKFSAPTTTGSGANWLPAALDCTVMIVGYGWTQGYGPKASYGIGPWTIAENLAYAQSGLVPPWWRKKSGRNASIYPAGNRLSYGATDANVTPGASGGTGTFTASSVSGARTGGAGAYIHRLTTTDNLAAIEQDLPQPNTPNDLYYITFWARITSGVGTLFTVGQDGSGNGLPCPGLTSSWQQFKKFVYGRSIGYGGLLITLYGETGAVVDIDDLVVLDAGEMLTPVINPGEQVIHDLGANKIPGFITSGSKVVGNNREHDLPIRLSVTHTATENLQFGGQAVLNTTRDNVILYIAVTADKTMTWSLGNAAGGAQYVSAYSLTAGVTAYIPAASIVTNLLSGGSLWSKPSVSGATVTLSLKAGAL